MKLAITGLLLFCSTAAGGAGLAVASANMPDKLTEMTCAEAMSAIEAAAEEAPQFVHYEHEDGINLLIDAYDAEIHGDWSVAATKPASGEPIGAVVEMYIFDPWVGQRDMLVVASFVLSVLSILLLGFVLLQLRKASKRG